MNSKPDGGGGRRNEKEVFLSAHRCPEVDLLPHHESQPGIVPPGSVSANVKQAQVTSTGQSESNYLDVSSTPHCDEDEDGTISDWSEEDLSLHFSPSVIISSDDEECTFDMPASTTSGDADSYRVYRGLIAGANQGLHVGANSKQRLQKSFSLDESKTKMASCIIKNVLSKKMQAEQNHSKTPHGKIKPTMVPNLPQPVEQPRVSEGAGGETGGGVTKAPIHVVRDMRSLVKNTYSHTMSTSHNSKPLGFKLVGQGGSPPPTYQQAVGVKSHDHSKNSLGGTVKQVTAVSHAVTEKESEQQTQSSNHTAEKRQRANRNQESTGRCPRPCWGSFVHYVTQS
ncbi:hypothetical protein fugu_008640 [Takifugu bimaculatus]|uniref:Uncharacterized protein n=1 Tax=Takifugu bimaculatus TaxID=433685 RepID=A0A4Z2AWC1_9TELE|nr:hypothetical protein fugu_008640 [Takifugu bimaculatus]